MIRWLCLHQTLRSMISPGMLDVRQPKGPRSLRWAGASPKLPPGDIVILKNASDHKGPWVQAAEARPGIPSSP